jgi:hypothetical protein
MTRRFKTIFLTIFTCLSVLPTALRAQGYHYSTADGVGYHASSVYYVTLKDASGENINSRYAAVGGAIGAFVGDELRGSSVWAATGNTAGQGVFVIRVWGGKDDAATVTFRLRDQAGLEYQIGTEAFAKNQEGTYGSPSAPLSLTMTPVTGISLGFTEVTLKQGETREVAPSLLPANHSELLTTLTYAYTSSSVAVFSVSDGGIVTAEATGQGKLTVKTTPGNFTAEATVKVEAKTYVHVTEIRNNMTSTNIELLEGDQLQLDFTVLPEDADDKTVSIKNTSYDILDIRQDTETSPVTIVAKKPGSVTLVITSNDNAQAKLTYQITVKALPQVSLSFAAQSLDASKLRDVTLTLNRSGDAVFRPEKVELVFSKATNGDAAATAVKADNSGLKWTVSGQYVGRHTVKIKYNGEELQPVCSVNIPAEYVLEKGWGWMSVYAATGGAIPLKNGEKWITLQIDANNKVEEIRSQTALLYNDPQLGLFGDIEQLSAVGGMYKVYCIYADNVASRMVLNAGYQNLVYAHSLQQPQVRKGYTWVTYPHEKDHSLATVGAYLAKRAARGDLIIGRDLFAEYDGEEWMAPDAFRFEAGQGYIYYSASDTQHALDWGPITLKSEAAARMAGCGEESDEAEASRAAAEVTPWVYDPYAYSDCMAVVARLDGIADPENFSVGAFVDGECRGRGEAARNGLMYIAVSGERGERVSFRLYDKSNQTYHDIEGTGISFMGRKGSHEKPLMLRADITSVSEVTGNGSQAAVYDLQGRLVSPVSNASSFRKGIYVKSVTVGGHRVTRKVISK